LPTLNNAPLWALWIVLLVGAWASLAMVIWACWLLVVEGRLLGLAVVALTLAAWCLFLAAVAKEP
jgi:hypothetical protein